MDTTKNKEENKELKCKCKKCNYEGTMTVPINLERN